MGNKKSKKQMIKMLLSIFTGTIGSSIFSFVIGLLVLKSTDSILNFGFTQLIGPVISIMLLPFIGGIIDKYNRKKIIVISQISSMLALILFALSIKYNILSLLNSTYILLIVLKIADSFLQNSAISSISNILLDSDIQKYKSLEQVIVSGSGIISPIIAAVLLTKFSLVEFTFLEVVMEAITLIIVLFVDFKFTENNIDKEENLSEDDNLSIIQMFKSGLKYVIKNNVLVFMIIVAMIVNLIFSSFIVGLPYVEIKQLHFSDYIYGISFTIFSVGMILGGIILSLFGEIQKKIKFLMGGILIFSLLTIVLGISFMLNFQNNSYIYIIFIFNLLSAILISFINMPMNVWMVKNIPSNYQGRVFSLLGTLSQLLIPIGILIYSFAFEYINYGLIFIVNGIMVITFCLIIPSVYKIDINS